MDAVLSGLHPRQTMEATADDAPHSGLPLQLKQAGYYTAGVGEVGRIQKRLDETVLTCWDQASAATDGTCWYHAAAKARGFHAAASPGKNDRKGITGSATLDPQDDIDGFIADQAVEMLGRLPEDRPWAMFVIFAGPGNGQPAPRYFDTLVDHADLTRRFAPISVGSLDPLLRSDRPRTQMQSLDRDRIAKLRSDYLGRVGLIDRAVGQLHGTLTQRRDANHNWSLLTADRGMLLGEYGLLGHESFLSGAIEVPLIVEPPAGAITTDEKFQDGMVQTIDLTATAASLAGADMPTSAVGRSVLPMLRNEPMTPDRETMLSEFADRLMIENELHKASFQIDTGRCLTLFDMVADPDEKRNLVELDTSEPIIDQLLQKIAVTLMPLR
jgi:arylsulfatase A-like enzyme